MSDNQVVDAFVRIGQRAVNESGLGVPLVCTAMITAGVILAELHGDKGEALKLLAEMQDDLKGEMN